MDVDFAVDVQGRAERIIGVLGLGHVNPFRVICMRSRGCTANAYARIWNLPQIWQKALAVEPYYVIEVLAEKFDCLADAEKDRVIIHELMHIPKTFSGALVPHECFGKKIDRASVERIYRLYCERSAAGKSF